MKLQSYLSLLLPLLAAKKAYSACRCLYGQSCWPSEAEFSTLASQISQPLLKPLPPAAACYPGTSPSGNCSDVLANTGNGQWRSDHPGALQNVNFESHLFHNGTVAACYLNVTLGIPCEQGSIPPVGVDARTASDVQAAVNFARTHNLRLAVKNTGHDYLGRSTARNGFMLWTHHLKDRTRIPAFIPQGAPSTATETFDAVTFGAGVQWHEAYDFVQQEGRFIVGGLSAGSSVGAAGGWIMGGGHSAFAPRHGLGVDNVLQFDIVLSDGSLVTTNAYQHSDLFWALRGGGGGTYGVVTATTYRTHAPFPLKWHVAQTVTTELMRLTPKLADAAWGGYTWISNQSLTLLYVAPDVSWADANATILPFAGFVANATGGANFEAFTVPFTSFYEWYKALYGNPVGQVGGRVEIASRLLPQAMTEQDPAKVAQVMLSIEGGVATNSVAGGAVSRVDPDSMGLNPSWRKAVAHIYASVSWQEGATGDVIRAAQSSLKKSAAILDTLTTDSGSYLNEGSMHEVDFKKAYFGSHYEKLKSIKDKYDPTTLFVVASGVGSDEWKEDLVCRR
ncbi:hypothetical protein B0H34DRAFT_789625 [Crassisporium funariophilum]|nr:hypothetical protein B0H34DRAFT_789625 [Crassisporium funariophilum]